MSRSSVPNRTEILKLKFTQSIGLPFQKLLPESQIEQAIKELSIKYRHRLFDPFVTLWAFLSQVLDVDKSCHNTVSRVIAWLATENVEIPSTDTSAYCQARKRLPEQLLQKLFEESGESLEIMVTPEHLWCGRHVQVIDCSTVSMPDTLENQKSYPQSNSQKLGCGFPIAKIGVLFSLATGAAIALVIDVLNTNDIKLARRLYQFLKPFDVLLGDSAFCSYADFLEICRCNCDAVIRKHNSRCQKLKGGVIVGQNDKIVTWHKPRTRPKALTLEEFAALPKMLQVREISDLINISGFRTQSVSLITTLLDTDAFPTHALTQLYRDRWDVELDLKHLKTTLGMDILRSKTPAMIRKEIYAFLLAYNLLRSVMWDAGTTYGTPPLRLSLQGTRHHLRHFLPQLKSVPSPQRDCVYSTLLKVIVHKAVPKRPQRVEPRVKKRRPKTYPYMSVPRSFLRKKLMVA
ncbi:IS4 family transposase [Nostoc sp. 106C]|uniref:IS4 family transposase n=1 Tax=Nostoc sp. 106C TaxID=1932667 RepID=UPI000A3C3514|nr:IS4 family transposase [Nostoc sp. 106C]OUL22210.1 transposase [Nostoc sp. 106C]